MERRNEMVNNLPNLNDDDPVISFLRSSSRDELVLYALLGIFTFLGTGDAQIVHEWDKGTRHFVKVQLPFELPQGSTVDIETTVLPPGFENTLKQIAQIINEKPMDPWLEEQLRAILNKKPLDA